MTPNDQIQEVRQEVLWNVVGFAVLHPILMQNEHVEPFLGPVARAQELNIIAREQSMQPLVMNSAESVERHICGAFSKEERRDDDLLHRGHFAEIVQKASRV